MVFRYYPVALQFVATRPIAVPPQCAANLFRGALGALLRNTAREHYQEMFTPHPAEGPSGLRDRPRPFVFRTADLDGKSILPGEVFTVRMNVFEPRAIEPFVEAWKHYQLAQLQSVSGTSPQEIPLLGSTRASHVQVRFVTPLELKNEGRIVAAPSFDVLLKRIRDRVSAISELYGHGPLDLDFRSFAERAALVRMTRSAVQQVTLERTSRNTGQTHPLGGLIGEAEYEGELGEFLPYLEVARHSGVGRQTVWGKGEIHLGVS